MTHDAFVLIVGGGPVGLSAALELKARGVPAILVTRNTATAQHPKCNMTNARSMEHFRRLGIAGALRAGGLPQDLPRESAYVTRFCGYEMGRLPRPRANWPTPELPNFISQIALERELLATGQRMGADLRFGAQLTAFEDHGYGVTATVLDVASGMSSTVTARYLLACDGASSMVRRALGFGMTGRDGSMPRAFMGGTMMSYYIEAPGLFEASQRTPCNTTWIINPEMRGLMYSQDGRSRWIVHYQVLPGIDPAEVEPVITVRAMLGTDLPFNIISGGPWTGGLAMVSDRYQQGQVLLAGDAAHLFTPLGGFGMNTGIGDVMNVCWKLAAEHDGWAAPGLVASYEAERRPIGLRNVQLGIHCSDVMDGWAVAHDIEDATPSGAAARAALGQQAVREDRVQYHTVGLQLGERYEGSPIVVADGTPAPADSWDSYTPQARPGGRAPHAWLKPGEALFDRFGPGFTLLDQSDGDEATPLLNAARVAGIPMRHLRPAGLPDGLYGRRLTLIRPDQHVAWHADAAPDPASIVARISGGCGD